MSNKEFKFNKYEENNNEKMELTLISLDTNYQNKIEDTKQGKPEKVSDDVSKRRRSKKNGKDKKIIKITMIVLLTALTVTGIFAYSLYYRTKNAIDSNKVQINAAAKTNFTKEPSNILIMGSDENVTDKYMNWRKDSPSYSRVDNLILMHFDPIKKTITTSSMPRDTAIKNTCTETSLNTQYKKINATTNSITGENEEQRIIDGMNCITQEYKNNFNIQINYIVRINMRTVMTIVNEIGGLEFAPNPNNFGPSTNGVFKSQDEYDNKNVYEFVSGQMRKFNGSEALSYGRYRDDSDFYRGVRQQEILKEIIKKITSNVSLINNIPNLINKVSNDVKYNFSGDIMDDIIFLSKDLSKYQTIPLEKFDMVQAPGLGAEDYILTDESLKTFTGVYNGTIDPTKIETPKPSN